MTTLGDRLPPDPTVCPECGSRRLWVSRRQDDERRFHLTSAECEACGLEARADASGVLCVTRRGDLTAECRTAQGDE